MKLGTWLQNTFLNIAMKFCGEVLLDVGPKRIRDFKRFPLVNFRSRLDITSQYPEPCAKLQDDRYNRYEVISDYVLTEFS